MATKPKSRVNTKNSSQLTQFKFRWWMALILVAVIAIIGIVIIRFSHASSVTNIYAAQMVNIEPNRNSTNCRNAIALYGAGWWCYDGQYTSGFARFRRTDDGRCAFLRRGANDSKGSYYYNFPTQTGWVTVNETTSCNV